MSWRLEAKCRGKDVNFFFPERGAVVQIREIKKFCADCPVQQECLDDSLVEFSREGFYAGMSGASRRAYARSKGIHLQ